MIDYVLDKLLARYQLTDCLRIVLTSDDVERYIEKRHDVVFFELEDHVSEQSVLVNMESLGYRLYYSYGSYFIFLLITVRVNFNGDFLKEADKKIIAAMDYGKWPDHLITTEYPARFFSSLPQELLVARRFDVALKAYYARLYLTGRAKAWRERVYYEQALRITGPSPIVREYDGSGKEGLDKFINQFNTMLDLQDLRDMPVVPTDRDMVLMDGAHRVTTSIVKQQLVNGVQFNYESEVQSGYSFFSSEENGHEKCPDEILDEGLIEYCRIKDSAALVLLFPSVADHTYALNVLVDYADIVCEKSIFMTPKAGAGLLRQVYAGHEWVNSSGYKTGFNHKVKSCFPYSGKMRVLLIDNYDITKLRSVKDKVRDFYKIGKHSVHITDSSQETIDIARVLFNQNSLTHLSMQRSDALDSFHNMLFSFKDWCQRQNIEMDNICVTSSAVLSAYGLRECADIDFLYDDENIDTDAIDKPFGCHNQYVGMYPQALDDILSHPHHHFWYMGVKFCSPQLVRAFKKQRGEQKDIYDITLLSTVIHEAGITSQICVKGTYFLSVFRRHFHHAFYRFKRLVKFVLSKVGLWKDRS